MTTAEEELSVSLALSPTEAYELAEEGFLTAEYLLDQLCRLIGAVPFCAVSDVKKLLKDIRIKPEDQKHLFDIEIAAYLINPLSSQYTHEDMGKPYAALTTWKRAQMLEERLEETGMRKLFDEVEMPLVFTLFDMEQDGIRVHAEELKVYGEALTGRIGELEKQIHAAAGEKFNINSPKQLGVILFESWASGRKENKDRLFHIRRGTGQAGAGACNRKGHSGIPAAYQAEIHLRRRAAEGH